MACEKWITHEVKQGDTLYMIARMHKTTVPELMMNNPGINPYNLQIGRMIKVCVEEEKVYPEAMNREEVSRQLYEALVKSLGFWTFLLREYAMEQGNPDAAEVTANLAKKQAKDAGEAFSVRYPMNVSMALGSALVDFTADTLELIDAVANGERMRVDELEEKIEEEIKVLSQMLGNVNVKFVPEEVEELLMEYYGRIKNEVLSYLAGEYEQSAEEVEPLLSIVDKLAKFVSEMEG